MKFNPSWAAGSCFATPEIPGILQNPRFNYHVREEPRHWSLTSARCIHSTLPSYYIKIHFNTNLPHKPTFS
jgi:hypothetical protein